MPFKLKIPFYTLNLQLGENVVIRYPLTDKDALQMGSSHQAIIKRFKELYQSKVLDQGRLIEILDDYKSGEFLQGDTSVFFPAASDGIAHPPLELNFRYFYTSGENGCWGIIPVLGIEAYGKDEYDLEMGLKEVVKLDFLKNRRLHMVQDVLETIWFKSVTLNFNEIDFKIPSPGEVTSKSAEKSEKLLHQVAQEVVIIRQQLFGMEKEMEQLIRNAKNKYTRNILLVGAHGIGKTTMVWEFARIKKQHRIPGKIWETTASLLIKELVFGGGWKPNLVSLIKEINSQSDFLFVRNLMELFEVGKYEGNTVSMAEYMQTFLAKGTLSLISECTEEELAKIELDYPGFLSQFHLVRLQQPQGDVLENIIIQKITSIARHQKITITEEAVREMIRLINRFMPYEGMPGTPIRFLERLILHRTRSRIKGISIVSAEVTERFCKESGLPVFMVDPDIPMNLKLVTDHFTQNIFGQNQAIDAVVDTLATVKMGLSRKDKPIASLLFTGPTGVGKTELAKTLASYMFGSRDRMVRFDMSEFADPLSIYRLSGYSGQEGLLSDAIRKEPFCVLLFDEVEKADQGFFDLLLQILGEGRLTDGAGRLVNFCSTIILMTSNIGVDILKRSAVSLVGKNKERELTQLSQQLDGEVQKFFRPELYNRIDKVVIFKPLDHSGIRKVVDREIEKLFQRDGLKHRKISLTINKDVYDYFGRIGYDENYGARFLQRSLREGLVIPLAKAINHFDSDDQLVVDIRLEHNKIRVVAEEDPLGFELLLEELEVANYANHASSLRRSIANLKESHLYNWLNSELEMIESKGGEGDNKSSPWKNANQSRKYHEYYKCKEIHERLTEAIEAYEEALSLAYLNFKPYAPQINKEVDQWTIDFFHYKLKLISTLRPEFNDVFLAIYGSKPEAVARFYVKLFKSMQFSVTGYSVWFRERYYQQEILHEVEDETGEIISRRGPREKYIRKPVGDWEKPIRPEQKGDLLYGFEITISGPCVFLAAKSETGMQSWNFGEHDERLFLVKVANKTQETPKLIHRSESYKRQKSMRRVEVNKEQNYFIRLKSGRSKEPLASWLEEKIMDQLVQEVEKAIK
jgi:ATP-dependent Clp protease ATP-binding subunit ClpA